MGENYMLLKQVVNAFTSLFMWISSSYSSNPRLTSHETLIPNNHFVWMRNVSYGWAWKLTLFFLILLWVMRVYIIWVRGKKVTLKILQVESFMGTLQDGLSRKVFAKCSLTLDSSTSSMCFSCGLFVGTFTHELLAS